MDWLQHTVTAEETGRTVREIATGALGVSGRMIQRLTRSRGISLNRKPAQLSRKVREGDVVAVKITENATSELEPVEMALAVAYEDDDVLVIDKPPLLLVHPVAPHHTRTLAHGIAHYYKSIGLRAKVRPVHRLDRDTSGLILIAKNAYAHQHLDRQLRDRSLRREYLALVGGEMETGSGVVDAPIARRKGQPALREVAPGGDPAVTRYRVVQRLRGVTLVALELETGRTHQIRVHMAHLGHPLLGDDQYGGRTVPGLTRQALHASRVTFTQPRSRASVELASDLPPDLAAARDRFRGPAVQRPQQPSTRPEGRTAE